MVWENIFQYELVMYLRPIILLFLVYLIAKIVSWFLERMFEKLASIKIHIDPTLGAVLRRIVVFIIYTVGIIEIIMGIPQLQALAYSLFAGAGVIAIIVGYAGKDILSNILSGVVIALFEPFKIGDHILFHNEYGIVEDITLRHTVIRTRDQRRIIVPNSVVSSEIITNYSLKDPRVKKNIDITISYESSIDKARKVMIEEAKKHTGILHGIAKKQNYAPKVYVEQLADSGVVLRLECWAEDEEKGYYAARDLRETIKKRFDKEKIEIPYPHRMIMYKKEKK